MRRLNLCCLLLGLGVSFYSLMLVHWYTGLPTGSSHLSSLPHPASLPRHAAAALRAAGSRSLSVPQPPSIPHPPSLARSPSLLREEARQTDASVETLSRRRGARRVGEWLSQHEPAGAIRSSAPSPPSPPGTPPRPHLSPPSPLISTPPSSLPPLPSPHVAPPPSLSSPLHSLPPLPSPLPPLPYLPTSLPATPPIPSLPSVLFPRTAKLPAFLRSHKPRLSSLFSTPPSSPPNSSHISLAASLTSPSTPPVSPLPSPSTSPLRRLPGSIGGKRHRKRPHARHERRDIHHSRGEPSRTTLLISTPSFSPSPSSAQICAALDWWPADKCDYERCPWAGEPCPRVVLMPALSGPPCPLSFSAASLLPLPPLSALCFLPPPTSPYSLTSASFTYLPPSLASLPSDATPASTASPFTHGSVLPLLPALTPLNLISAPLPSLSFLSPSSPASPPSPASPLPSELSGIAHPGTGGSMLSVNLSDPLLLSAARSLAPFFLRLGGSLSDQAASSPPMHAPRHQPLSLTEARGHLLACGWSELSISRVPRI